MKLFLHNPVLEKQVENLVKSFKKRMNGETVRQMEERGLVYEQNYGISWLHLKEMAKGLPHEWDLANRLWHRPIRETMLLATLIVPLEEITIERGKEWATRIVNSELVEKSAHGVYGRAEAGKELSVYFIEQEDVCLKALGFYSLGWQLRLNADLPQPVCEEVIMQLERLPPDESLVLYRGVAHYLRQVIRMQPEHILDCEELCAGWERSEYKWFKWLAAEVKLEML
jgi:3-methyladenine DNA glycosylase AlkD